MSWKRRLAGKLTVLAIIWLLCTISLVSWWWLHALHNAGSDARMQRMFLWEGSFLLLILLGGGVFLVYLTHHHQQRHERLKMFFSTFAHDLKTSMTRLRLQGELLGESKAGQDPKVKAMLKDIQKLDLQLENSLWMSQLESDALLMEKVRLRDVMDHLRNEFSEMQLEMSKDADLWADRRAFTIVLRNLFHNSILHGKADRIEIHISSLGESVRLEIRDNGSGLTVPVEKLGRDILSSRHERSNGLGLFLSRRLIEKMSGRLDFESQPRFSNVLSLKGSLR
ncbi:MAG: HAMP domain-containing histidine kinase [Bdellovibrionaceae bacterium]|nr:HAMP domain-containing histidine kinase [Pseudobdellovibrionaceae bacterium]MBX3034123.1 HAMP domain-containing histidine kinase [Pseudobdellovibrionaceae bacterium]